MSKSRVKRVEDGLRKRQVAAKAAVRRKHHVIDYRSLINVDTDCPPDDPDCIPVHWVDEMEGIGEDADE
jgi:hypothetical protein